ncbi:elongation factor 1-delta-like isoform X2 [Sycon ciliatum]|uniref:elongation factor 1-delta-like isoform X2 n=1 Tax=Sycon ciliatum TaxID=27933 RepID=UPI0031F720AF
MRHVLRCFIRILANQLGKVLVQHKHKLVRGDSTIAQELERARSNIQRCLSKQGAPTKSVELTPEMAARVEAVEKENRTLRQTVSGLQSQVEALAKRLAALESGSGAAAPVAEPEPAQEEEEEDDFDLFGDDAEEDDEEKERVKAERIAAYTDRKSKKTAVIAKSNIILDVKPWDDETDMKEMERLVRTIEVDGLLWGSAKLAEVGYGIKKLVISCVVEDDKVGTDLLEEEITKFEDLVQSVDIAAFNKI